MAHLENLALQRPVKTQIWLGTSCNDDLRSQLKFANVQLTLVSSLQDVLSRIPKICKNAGMVRDIPPK